MCTLKESSKLSNTPTPVTTPGFCVGAAVVVVATVVAGLVVAGASVVVIKSALGHESPLMTSQRQPINSENPGKTSSRHRQLIVAVELL